MVKLASTLPKEYDDNGLESNTRHLLEIYTSQKYVAVVALMHTKDVHHTEDFERVPRVEIVHIEVALDTKSEQRIRDLLLELHDARVSHVKQPLNLPDADDEVELVEPRAIEAGDDVVDAELVDEETTNEEEN